MSRTDARAARLALERLIADDPPHLPPAFADEVERYVALLLDANRHLNLTRVVEPEAIAKLHLLDSLAALRSIDGWATERALDLGSGGGIPGLVLAIARPDVRWTLVDSVAKKADALRSFVAELGLSNVDVLSQRAEEIGRGADHREAYPLVTARACAALPVLVEYALPLLADGGHLMAWKGRIGDEELQAGATASDALGGGTPEVLPSGFTALGDHRFVVIVKERPTPPAYPRRAGVPSRRPLG